MFLTFYGYYVLILFFLIIVLICIRNHNKQILESRIYDDLIDDDNHDNQDNQEIPPQYETIYNIVSDEPPDYYYHPSPPSPPSPSSPSF